MELGAWDMHGTYSGHIGRTFPLTSLGIGNNRIINYQVMVLSDAMAAEGNRQEVIPLRTIAFAYPGTFPAGGGTGRPYTIDNAGLNVGSESGVTGKPFPFKDNSNYWSTSTANRGFLKVDYIAAQCADRNGSSAYPNFAQIGLVFGDECGGGMGSATSADEVVEAYGAGIGAGGTTDHFSYLYRNETNAATTTFTARLDNVEKTADGAQFGITFRGATANNAPHAALIITPNAGVKMLTRFSSGGATSTTQVTGLKTPTWVRIQKIGKVFSFDYHSDATTTWTSIGQVYMPNFPASYTMGFGGANAVASPALNTGSASSAAYSYMSGYFKLKNRWIGTYLHTEAQNGKVQEGNLANAAENIAQWLIEPTDGGFFRIKNRQTGQYMHVENQTGTVQYGPLNTSWSSMQWTFDMTANFLRIRNRWNGQIINVENKTGYAQASSATVVPNSFTSAQWYLEPM
jgi:hypothetical protein